MMSKAIQSHFHHLPPELEALARRCEAEGGRAFLVGGCVRDRLLGRQSKDLDLEVYGLEVDALVHLLKSFGPVNEVGRSFGVFKLALADLEVDVSIPRRDSNVGPGHRGIAVAGDPHMSVADAARRRDLTINALLYDILRHELLDPHGGLPDLQEGILRPVDETTFLEDPLRAVRAVQFAARLEFLAAPALHHLCEEASLDELPPERIQGEWQKLLLKSKRPSIGLRLARSTKVLERLFPELKTISDHEHADHALDHLASGPRDELSEGQAWALMLGVWLHRCDERTIEAVLDRLWLHRWQGYRLREKTIQLASCLNAPIDSDTALRQLSTRCELEITLLARWSLSQRSEPLAALERAKTLQIHLEKPKPILLGRHLAELDIPPGPAMGSLLREVYEEQLNGHVTDLETAKRIAASLHKQKGPA